MLEVLNVPLLLYLTVLCALRASVPYLVKPMLACFCRQSMEERNLWSQILKLKVEQKAISMKDQFAAYSKLQRKIIKLESELKEKAQSRTSKNIALKGTLNIALQGFVGLMMLASVIWFRREPLVQFYVDLTPFATILSYPTQVPNSISAHIWVLISNYSIKTMLNTLSSSQTVQA